METKRLDSIDPNEFVAMFVGAVPPIGVSDDVLKEICLCINDLREGVMQETLLTELEYRRLTFKGCVVESILPRRGRFVLKTSHPSQAVEAFNIYLTPEKTNRVEVDEVGIKRWYCVKDEGKYFPKAGREFLKFKFARIDEKKVMQILSVHDAYIQTYNKVMAQQSTSEEV